MSPTREQIYTALWSLITSNINAQGQFVTMQRYLRHFADVSPGEMPALYMEERGEQWVKKGKGIPAIRTLKADVLIYVNTGDPLAVLPSTLVNNALDVLDDIVEQPGNPGNVQTLGGIVEHVYIEGQVAIAEGLLQSTSIVRVPITVLIP
ncbi:MAG TPA: hypothetical protein VMS04_15610 [Vicinamibacterales bacterium]|nr:hypothetical protein [Vicinamibacterales bacterium]